MSGRRQRALCWTNPRTRRHALALNDLQTLHYEVHDGIATITLHRPEKLNAFTTQMRDSLVVP